MVEIKRIPRKAKKGRNYVRFYVPKPDWTRLGLVHSSNMGAFLAMYYDAQLKFFKRRNTRGSRQYVSIMNRQETTNRNETTKR